MNGAATISGCGRYRYELRRWWDDAEHDSRVNFIMLNPSTADANVDDPTIRRCIGFARAWGFGELVVTNLFAWRATDPRELRAGFDCVGHENDAAIFEAARLADQVVCAWGAHGWIAGRGELVRRSLRMRSVEAHHLGLTKAGQPRHPLYLRGDLTPARWESPA